MPRKKPTRRAVGDGSVRRRPNGGYEVRVSLGTVNGKRVRQSFYGETLEQAQTAAWEAKRRFEAGEPTTTPELPLATFLAQWVETKDLTIRETTAADYRAHLRRYILPVLGDVAIGDLTPVHVSRWVAGLQARGLSVSTVYLLHSILASALKAAVAWGVIERNVASLVKVPLPKPEPGRYYTDEDLARLLPCLGGRRTLIRYDLIVLCLLGTGLRIGELLALRWSDIDHEAGMLRVERTAVWVKGKGIVFSDPKTATSKREVGIPQFVQTALDQQSRWQDGYRAKQGVQWIEQGLVFTTLRGGPLPAQNVRARFRTALIDAGLPPGKRLHDFRHTNATVLRAIGIADQDIMDSLGHSNQKTMRRYAQPTKPVYAKTAEAVDRALSGLLSGDHDATN